MKKFYTNPKMTVSKFDAENVITSSGGINGNTVEDPTNLDAGKTTEVSWNAIYNNKVTFTF